MMSIRSSSRAREELSARWEAQIRKGCLEMAILASLWKSKLYGLEILQALEGRSSLGLAEGTLYLILNRLKTERLVDSQWVDRGTGHPRKYYWLTAAGESRLRIMARFWVRFSAGLDSLLEPVVGRKESQNAKR
jgi:PadR family transcriptional regulator PadR